MKGLSVPWLRSGTGKTPADGGCIMQIVDWIHRGSWTDSPPCVEPALQGVAINLNDTLGAQDRQRLLDLAPRLMHTVGLSMQERREIAISIVKRLVSRLDSRSLGVFHSDRRGEFRERAMDLIGAMERSQSAPYVVAEIMERGARLRDESALYWRGGVHYNLIEAVWQLTRVSPSAIGFYTDITQTVNAAIESGKTIDEKMELFGWILDEFHERLGTEKIDEIDFGPVCKIMAGAPA